MAELTEAQRRVLRHLDDKMWASHGSVERALGIGHWDDAIDSLITLRLITRLYEDPGLFRISTAGRAALREDG